MIKDKRKKAKILFGAVAIVVIVALVMVSLNSDYYQFFIQRFQDAVSEDGMSYRLEHTAGGIALDSFFGAGYGHYGMAAKSYNGWFIQDSQYQKTLAELGVFGFALFIVMLLSAGFSAFKKNSVLELCILSTYMISFIGSSSISAETTFPFIFWYVLGCISRKNNHKIAITQRIASSSSV